MKGASEKMGKEGKELRFGSEAVVEEPCHRGSVSTIQLATCPTRSQRKELTRKEEIVHA